MSEEEKTIDESWKKQVQKEKEVTEAGAERAPFPEANFVLFLSGLATQALIALGEIENPVTQKKEKNLAQAKFTIDTLQILQEKTKGNLTLEEKKYLDELLYDLRMSYVASSK